MYGSSGRCGALLVCLAVLGGCGRPNEEPTPASTASSAPLLIATRTSWTATGTAQPAGTQAGALLPAVRVAITDNTNTVVTGTPVTVTLSVAGNTAVLGGTTSVTTVNGIAEFTDLFLVKTGSYRFIASALGLTSATSAAFTISAAPSHRLEFTVQPSGVAAGALFSPAVQVSVLDPFGNLSLTPTTVVMSLQANPGSSTLTGTTTLNTTTGRASFTTLKLNRPGAGYSLSAAATGLPTVVSNPFDVQLGAASRFVVISGSGQAANVGTALTFPLVIESQDVAGNVVGNVPVRWVYVTGAGTVTAGASVTDATTGRAQATVLLGTSSGAQRIEAQSAGVTTAAFTATARALAASQLVLVSGDGQTGTVGQALAAPLVVATQDTFGNPVANQVVTFSVTSGGCTLSTAAPRTDAAGRASVTVTLGPVAGAGVCAIQATRAGLAGSPISFLATATPGAAAQLAFTQSPTSVEVGVLLGNTRVAVTDAFGNPTNGSTVTVSLVGGTAGSVLGGTTSATAMGEAVFADLTVDRPGTAYTLVATAGAASVTSTPFDVRCRGGLLACGGQCVDSSSDLTNCGACGNTCSANRASSMACIAGACSVTACTPGFGNCDGNAFNGCERDLSANANHCGACGRACPSGVACTQGMCGGVEDATQLASTAQNPNGPWSYGKESSGSFARFTTTTAVGGSAMAWNDGASVEPSVVINQSGGATSPWGASLPNGALALMPGATEPAVLRWIAPAAGTYRLYAKFAGVTNYYHCWNETVQRTAQDCANWKACRRTNEQVSWNVFCFFGDYGICRPYTKTIAVRHCKTEVATPDLSIRVRGTTTFGPAGLNGNTEYVSIPWTWSTQSRYGDAQNQYNWYVPVDETSITAQHTGDNERSSVTTLQLAAGDAVELLVSAGIDANSYDLTQVSARLERSCAAGFAECDGDSSNGCETNLAAVGGSCDALRVSEREGGADQAWSSTSTPAISGDGRLVAFVSGGADLSDSAAAVSLPAQAYVFDRITGQQELISRSTLGQAASSAIAEVALSANGRWVLFTSAATNLPGPAGTRLFLFDRQSGVMTRPLGVLGASEPVDVSSPSLSGDGRMLAFVSAAVLATPDTNGVGDAFVFDRAVGTVKLLTPSADGPSTEVTISRDGTRAAMSSTASNLVPNDTNGQSDVFVFDLGADQLTLASTSTGGQGNGQSLSPSLSGDGSIVAFMTVATNLGCGGGNWKAIVRESGTTSCVGPSGTPANMKPSLSSDGRRVAITTDGAADGASNGSSNIVIVDRQTGQLRTASRTAAGAGGRAASASPVLSGDGRYVAYTTAADNLALSDGNASFVGWDVMVSSVQRDPEVVATVHPAAVTAGEAFSVGVAVFDARGTPVAAPTDVTISTTGTIAGTTTSTITSTGTFSGLSINAAGDYDVAVSAAGFSSRSFRLRVNPAPASHMAIVSGDAQTGTVATSLTSFVVRVTDAFGNPISGRQVDWTVVQGNGSITPALSLTTASGETTATATLATTSGANAFLATSGTLTAAFSAVGTPDAPASIAWTVQPPASVTAGVVMSPAPVVALLDAYGNAVDNVSESVSVRWLRADFDFDFRVPSLQGVVTVPFSGGRAVMSGLFANETHSESILATTASLSAASDLVTITAGSVSAVTSALSANPMSAEANGAEVVTVLVLARDQFLNRISNALPSVQVTGSGNQLTAFAPTNSQGGSPGQLTSTRAETKTLSATLNGVQLSPVDVTFTPLSNCAASTSDCNGDSTDGCEADLTSVTSCGVCGVACGGGMTCTAGSCGCPSSAPTTCGSGATASCADLTADPANCGACGTACAVNQACTTLGCTETCTDTQPPDEVVAIEIEPTGGNIVPGVADTTTFRVFGRMRRTPWQRVDVSSQATFDSSNASTVDVSSAGVALSPAGTVGTETITATVNGHTATARVRVWAPARYAQLQDLTLNVPGFTLFGVVIGGCYPVSATATFSDNSTEDVSETTDFAVVGMGGSGTSPRTTEMRVMDQNLLTIPGGAFQNPDIGRYVDLIAQLVPGLPIGLLPDGGPRLPPSVRGYVGGAAGTCADSRSPGPRLAVATNPNTATLFTGETFELRSAALHADLSIRDVSTQAVLRTCAPSTLHVARDGWLTGLDAGSALVVTQVGSLVGHTPVTVNGQFPSPGALSELRLRPGAANVEPGQPFNLRAVASYANAGTKLFNVTSQTTWTSSNIAVAPVPVLGQGVAGAITGNSDITASFGSLTTTGAVRTWTPGRLASITSVSVVRPELFTTQGTCQQLLLRVTFANNPADREDLTKNATWWQGWRCFGDLSPTGVFWARGPFCTSTYIDMYGSMGFGLPGQQTVIYSGPSAGMADDFRDPVTCTP